MSISLLLLRKVRCRWCWAVFDAEAVQIVRYVLHANGAKFNAQP